jgi:hypothetical protein
MLYETILGQTVHTDFGENIAFEGGFAIHQRAHFQQLINQLPIQRKSHNFELYFENDELEAMLAKLHAHGIQFIHEIVEQPWKQRVMRFYDYDDHIIEIGERLEHVAYRLWQEQRAIEEICQFTALSSDAVRHAIAEYSTAAYGQRSGQETP